MSYDYFADVCVMVSMHGEDEPQCLTPPQTTPCKTFSYAITGGHDVVCINGTFHNVSEDIFVTDFEHSNEENRIVIVCKSCLLKDSKITLYGSYGKVGHVVLVNFTIRDSSFILKNIMVTFKDIVLEQVIIQDFEKVPNQVYFEGSTLSCIDLETCGLALLNSTVVKCIIKNSRLTRFKVNVNTLDLMLVINDTVILQPDIHVRVHSQAFLRVPSFIQFHNITVNSQGTTINSIPGPSRHKRSIEPLLSNSEITLDLTNPYIQISKSNLNRTPLEIIASRRKFNQAFFWGDIRETSFMNSNLEGDGAALTISSYVLNSRLVVSFCIFVNNTATKGFSTFKGHGGGVSITSESLDVEFKDSIFIDNKADDAGLALYTSTGVTVSLSNCSIYYSVDPINPIQGVLMFIAGKTTHIQSNFQVTNFRPDSYVGPINIFYVAIGNDLTIEIVCPKWYRHNEEHTALSSGSNTIRDMRYDCAPCSDNYYTTSAAANILSYSTSGNTSAIITESIDQSENICIECPYGAICTGNNVMPRPNYWGYWHEDELVFQQCPAGYCCSGTNSSTCNVYDYCEGNKTGILCGVCQEGFSVSILTGNCTPNRNCGNDDWFWLFAVLVALAYALWYTLKDDIFALLFATITFMQSFCKRSKSKINTEANIRNSKDDCIISTATVQHEADSSQDKNSVHDKVDNNDDDIITVQSRAGNSSEANISSQDGGDEESNDEDDGDKGYFGIVTYYVQMAAVIMIEIEFSDIDNSQSYLDRIVNNIAIFLNLELTQMTFDICPIVGLSAVGRHLYNLFFLLGIYASWSGVFTVTIIILAIMHKVGKIETLAKKLDSIKLKLIAGLIEIIKYTYAGFCSIIFMSLVCAQIGNEYVWWYDGTNVCLENWQIVIVIFAAFYAVPFPLTLAVGMKLLKESKISPIAFVCSCLFPLPALFIMLIYIRMSNSSQTPESSDTSETIISVLQGPYREDKKHFTLYWEAMVSVRRLLITGMTLVPYASIRMIIVTVLSVIFLVQHNYMSPFQVRSSNNVEALSLSLLLLASVLNLLKASLTDAGIVPSGPTVPFFKTVELCEKIFVLMIIAYILSLEVKSRKGKKKNETIEKAT